MIHYAVALESGYEKSVCRRIPYLARQSEKQSSIGFQPVPNVDDGWFAFVARTITSGLGARGIEIILQTHLSTEGHYFDRLKFIWGTNAPIVGSGIGLVVVMVNSFSVGIAMLSLESISSHCGKVQRSMWPTSSFAASSTV
jgi:hypothetical protein